MEQDLKQETFASEADVGSAEAEERQAQDAAAGNEGVSSADPETGGAEAGEDDPKYAELKRLADEHYQRQLRVQADFDNFRRRTQKEKEELAQYASLKLVTALLPVIDNFGRALQSGGESADAGSFAKGIDMINRQLWQVLEAEGLKLMEPVGQPFDPEVHQAIMQVESDEYEEGTVVEVVQPGYWLKDKVIRPAMVKVSG
ncbi:nucleotide exchange factor GrpE [Cohnella nanjingensis]|uniref:Protein GrpE n=1 Tax=Cohnella nanjingensis TaxID=1387779 RepID=A0A7X0RXC7_9BACL|nr:nucleotide exchange factor GrpE [Cohnella nanjingensis]MBB6675408.1 nucleotide exchange factor GrpE [Cohnella nanjingensis]